MAEKRDYGAVSPILLNHDQSIQVYGGGKVNWKIGTSNSYLSEVDNDQFDYLTGACLLVRSEVIKTIGFFDDKNFFMYWEDVDFGVRMKQGGWKIGACDSSRCFHEMSKSLGRFGVMKDYYSVISLIRFFKKHDRGIA